MFDFLAHLKNQRQWSEQTFGPGQRSHDVVILVLDGAWRAGHSPEQIIAALVAKQAKNEKRKWPDWRTVPAGKAIEHIRS